ncbi:MAG: thiazole synthase [Opitutales bacterium]|nr:thiazole synthase [Opitutales bacterium]|tara:strand:+ start:649 stop:1428 length:780 start_codon:yes stop_codon:yes gene_type:complete
MTEKKDFLQLGGESFSSRLFVGTGKFSSGQMLSKVVGSSGTEMVTVAMKRANPKGREDSILDFLGDDKVRLLPNTSGVRDAKEAVFVAKMAREALGTSWLKLEIHPDPKYLMPDPIETLLATEELVKEGFTVLPYCHADPVLCKRLEEAGSSAVMPLGSPIGSNRGLESREFLRIIIEQAKVPVVVDAGIGSPSQAAEAMEMGADAVLVNTALAVAEDPIAMACAFRQGVDAGRTAFLAGLGGVSEVADPTSPLTAFLD